MNPSTDDFKELSEITEEHLNFRAIDAGLGFAPKLRSSLEADRTRTGAGARLAGEPRFAPAPAPQDAAQRSSPSPVMLPAAPIKIRTAAFFIDAILVLGPWLGAVLWMSKRWHLSLINQTDVVLFSALFFISYFLLTESLGGQSLGKMLFKLRTVEDDKYEKPIGLKRTLVRIFSLLVGTVFLGLGLALALVDHKRRPWHDKFTGSIVRQKLY